MMFALATVADVSEPGPAGVPAAHAEVVPPHAVSSSAALEFSGRLRSALLDAAGRLDAQTTSAEQWRRALGDAVRGWKLSPSSCG